MFATVAKEQSDTGANQDLRHKINTAIDKGSRRQYHDLMLRLITEIENTQNAAHGPLSARGETSPPGRRVAIQEIVRFRSGGNVLPFKNELASEEISLKNLQGVIDDDIKQASKTFQKRSPKNSTDTRYLFPEPDITPLRYMTLHNTYERAKNLFTWQRSRGNCQFFLNQLCDFPPADGTANPEMQICLPNDRLLSAFIRLDNHVRIDNDRLENEISLEQLNELEKQLHNGECPIDLELKKNESAWLIAAYKEHFFSASIRELHNSSENNLQNSNNQFFIVNGQF